MFEPQADKEVRGGTVTRARATCLCCGAVLPPERVRAQLAAERSGADVIFDAEGRRTGGARMTAVVTLKPRQAGRHYRLPNDADYSAVRKAQERVAQVLEEWERGGKQGLCPVPDEPLPPIGTLGFRVQRYGMLQWGSWPIATERGSRLNARDTAALATSVHLICRPRPEDAPIGDWADVLRELPIRVADWIERLQTEGIRGADLVFACIGPALEIFSRYRAVETAEGDIIGLPNYLEKVWEVVGRAALQQVLGTAEAQARNGLSGALEEDARLTALFLWTLQSTAPVAENQEQDDEADEEAVAKVAATGFALPFDVVRRFAQPMGIDLDTWTDRIIGQEKGVVRLLPVAERAKKLFGEDGAAAAANYIESDPHTSLQQTLFPDLQDGVPTLVREPRPRYGESSDDHLAATLGDTTLDRVHTAMLLQSSGHANALRTLINAEQDRGPDFLRLANALSALYPQGCNEKCLLDAMLLAVPR